MDKDIVVEEIEQLGLEACTNFDRLRFELHKAEQELLILGVKKDFFKKYPNQFLKTKYGTFISATDKDHSAHIEYGLEQKIIQIKKELKREKTRLALVPNHEDYYIEEPHIKLVHCIHS